MSRRMKDRAAETPAMPEVDGTSVADGPDIGQLRDASLPDSPFPGGHGQDFRVFFAPEVYPTLWSHALAETSVEVCGVLVGRWGRDADGPFVAVSGSVQGDSAESKFAEVTFTHQTWAKINEEMDRNYPDLTIVGWYHTHPDFGVFLSDRDVFIQQHFFSEAGHIAHVIDPIRRTEGVFVWRRGKPSLAPHFWVGSELKTSTAAGSESRPTPLAEASAVATSSSPPTPPRPWLPPPERMLAYLSLLLLGYLMASFHSSWTETRLIEGTVAHYGLWQGLRPGLGESLDRVSDRLRVASKRVETLAADHLKRVEKEEDRRATAEDWGAVRDTLAESSGFLDKIKTAYELSPAEAIAVRDQIVRKLQELGGPPPSRSTDGEKAGPKKTDSPEPQPPSKPAGKP